MGAEVALTGHVHIVGIGGAGMSGIARILAARGVRVSGSDARESKRLVALRALGIEAHVGHAAEHVRGSDVVLVSTAIRPDNPEVVAARAAGIPVVPRADALAAVMAGSRGVAVAGTHGKTTTTSMLTIALQHCGADPSYAIGSELNDSGANAHQGSGELFVVEADESDGSFLRLPAVAGIVTNVEPDHLDHWGTFEAIEQAFLDFAHGLRDAGGFLVTCADDPGAVRLAGRARAAGVDVRTYGTDPGADVVLREVRTSASGVLAELEQDGRGLATLALSVHGEHNARNAAAALVAGIGLGFPVEELAEGLALFTGTRRRFDFKGEVGGIRVYDDYAHHPTEIAATLRAAREVVGAGNLVVAFQAHHYYRTAMFVEEFGQALGLADHVVVLEVYAPGEEPIPGASGQSMASHVPLPPDRVVFEPSWSAVAGHLAERARPGDLVMTLGAGDIVLLGPEVLDLLAARTGGTTA
ncbi:MAG: UDP-N-acetylmuramate--L-alanine ligase [Candidatus Nanopelagicales bacterium]|jgi:UDP-N-acetylmuramate--alanine ligase|nr:UDP-N-acetylmuramate--L-alanine ligase [Candidatus Nanopelagicales bacterium]